MRASPPFRSACARMGSIRARSTDSPDRVPRRRFAASRSAPTSRSTVSSVRRRARPSAASRATGSAPASSRSGRRAGTSRHCSSGPPTLAALAASPPTIPLPLAWPLTAPVLGDRFGPRGDRWHSGVDFPAPTGAPVYAARSGRVAWAGWRDGGWGFLVVVAHGHGERSMYAHLSRIDVRLGVWGGQGVRVGLIGASGDATGPHLHLEVRIRGAAVDPLRALP